MFIIYIYICAYINRQLKKYNNIIKMHSTSLISRYYFYF